MSSKRILITGGSGFVGAHLTRHLVEAGHHVVLMRSSPTPTPRLDSMETEPPQLIADPADAGAVTQVVWEVQPEIVYHLASTPFNPPGIPAATHFRVIVQGTLHLLEALREQGGGRMICCGSAAEYGEGGGLTEDQPLRPATLLGAAKVSASTLVETYSRLNGLEAIVLRLFTPYGPWEHPQRLIPSVIASAKAGRPVKLRGGTQQRDFFYVGDLMDAFDAAATASLAKPEVINLCAGIGRSVHEVAEMILKLMEAGVPIETSGAVRPDEIYVCSGNNTKARELLGWVPRTSLEEGLANTIAWFQENEKWMNQSN